MSEKPAKVVSCFGSKLSYWTFNDDKPVTLVMVHGFRGTHHGLQQIVDQLSDLRVIVPDLPAFGDSTPMTARHHDIDGYADCITALINELGLEKPHLLGHSFGSIIAANLAARKPKTIDKLVLVNPIAEPTAKDKRFWLLGFTTFYYWLGKKLPKASGRAMLSNRFMVRMVSSMMAKTKSRPLRNRIHAAHQKHFSTFHDPELLHQIYSVSVRSSVQDYAHKIKKPTLLIVGDVDNIAPIAGQRKLHGLFDQAKLLVIKRVGHLTHHEAPKRAARAIQAFLNEP